MGEASTVENCKHTLSSKLSVMDEALFEEQHDLLYRTVYPIDNYTKDNLGMTIKPVVDRAKYLNGQNQCNSKESFACGEDWFHYTREWLKK